ncbi:DUF6892 domain-containing protein [Streptomyces sp. NPDC058357]|uniref:DUF6892 domain-containing protein n=1 Tax=unclassified Streptomyces TaxID=2593676 RepID=UPI003646F2DB
MGEHGVEDLDDYVEENGFECTIFDEARACFEAMEIPEELLATVDELTFVDGLRGYVECAPARDGEAAGSTVQWVMACSVNWPQGLDPRRR